MLGSKLSTNLATAVWKLPPVNKKEMTPYYSLLEQIQSTDSRNWLACLWVYLIERKMLTCSGNINDQSEHQHII